MPPLNKSFVDYQFVNGAGSTVVLGSASRDDHTREINVEDAVWKFACPPQRRKSVSFDTQIRVEYLPNRDDWSEEERMARWHSADDYTQFQLDIFSTIYLLRNDPASMDPHSARGVECRDPIATRRRRQIRKEAQDVVFERQNIQRLQEDEPNGYLHLVASMYCYASQTAMRMALDTAAQDEIDANKIRVEEERLRNESVGYFSHDWISTTSMSRDENSSLGSSIEVCSTGGEDEDEDEDDFGFCVFGEKSGFDDSWLRGDV